MASFWRVAASRSVPPLLSLATATTAGYIVGSTNSQVAQQPLSSHCDAAATPLTANSTEESSSSSFTIPEKADTSNKNQHPTAGQVVKVEGMQHEAKGDYHGLFPLRQLWQPAIPYPLWNKNWDGQQPQLTGNEEEDRHMLRVLRKTGTTRHIILVRHGQYDESSKDDEKRILTPLGREQAHLTGKRIAEMIRGGGDEQSTPCKVGKLRVSGLVRARETADIIATHLDDIEVEEPDIMLNEGRPCHTIPGGPASEKIIEVTDAHHPRIEGAFQKYFFRAPIPEDKEKVEKHEFEIIVCHANVIRYWMCRALQLPPETWLRYCPFNCSLTYLTIRPTGTVSCRMLGDIGHLPYKASTFSGHHGYNW